MKVGIMSMQRIANYGSFLQAYALKKIISDLGNDVCFVDYHAEPPLVSDGGMKKTNHNTGLVFRTKLAIKKLLGKHIYFFESYKTMLPMLGVSDKMNYNTAVDALVIGSDEVFNCLQSNPDVGYSPELFGKDANAKKLISYGASFGFTTEDGLKKYKKYDEVKQYLKRFDALSVRDKNSAEIVNSMGLECSMHLDPVLIYGYENEININHKLSDYILVYSYDGRIKDETEIEKIREFAQKHGKKIVTVGFHQPWSDIKLEANPFELLSYFKKADYVVTDTFHGTIFSIITKRKFGVIIRESNRQKISALLAGLNLCSREIADINKLEDCVTAEADYETTYEIITRERTRAFDYLKNNLT